MNQAELIETLNILAETRGVFHSEADFQHALAWLIHSRYPNLKIRLEFPITGVGAIDIVLFEGGAPFLLELKYKTRRAETVQDDEVFRLRAHGAQPLGRYDFFKDIYRIERSIYRGAAIFLTNESQYWGVHPQGQGSAFSMQNGRSIREGETLEWQGAPNIASIGSGRTGAIALRSSYSIGWRNYSSPLDQVFRFLLVMVKPE